MNFWNKIFGKSEARSFKKTFKHLKSIGSNDQHAKNVYELMESLQCNTSEEETKSLIHSVNKIRYASNTNGYFEFFYPIVVHILYYKPSYSAQILHQIVGSSFANGLSDSQEMIEVMTRGMNVRLDRNKNYFTKEGQEWVNNTLQNLHSEIDYEIEKCQKELEEE